MSRQRQKGRPATRTRFKVGERVRVRQDVMDHDFPDMPLGGWAGTISEVLPAGMVTVRWNRETLASIHPVYKKRCQRVGAVLAEYCFDGGELERDPGGPLSIAQPNEVACKRLSAKNPADRVRMVFGLAADDPLPRPNGEALATYRDYLVANLVIPFVARYEINSFYFRPTRVRVVKAMALADDVVDDDGILCSVRTSRGDEVLPLAHLHPRRPDPNHQLVEDYRTWFFGELESAYDEDEYDDDVYDEDECEDGNEDNLDQHDENGSNDEEQELPFAGNQTSWRDVAPALLQFIGGAACLGGLMGSAVAVMPWAKWAAVIGGGLFGVAHAISVARSVLREPSLSVSGFWRALAGFLGLTIHALTGAFFGIAAVAFIGALSGAFVGFLLKRSFGGEPKKALRFTPGVVTSTVSFGVALEAYYLSPHQAAEGLLYGSLVGLGGAVFFCLAVLLLAVLTMTRPFYTTFRLPRSRRVKSPATTASAAVCTRRR